MNSKKYCERILKFYYNNQVRHFVHCFHIFVRLCYVYVLNIVLGIIRYRRYLPKTIQVKSTNFELLSDEL
jgi:hypothetical protein